MAHSPPSYSLRFYPSSLKASVIPCHSSALTFPQRPLPGNLSILSTFSKALLPARLNLYYTTLELLAQACCVQLPLSHDIFTAGPRHRSLAELTRAQEPRPCMSSKDTLERPFRCNWPGCTNSYARSEHLNRHRLNRKCRIPHVH